MVVISAMDNQADIAALCLQCLEGFGKLIRSLRSCSADLHQHMPPLTVESSLGRFKIWCGNSGALHRGVSSLDVRLRDSTVMRDTVLEFLERLRKSVETIMFDDHFTRIEIRTGERAPWVLELATKDTASAGAVPDEPSGSHFECSDDDDDDEESNPSDENCCHELAEWQSEIQDAIEYLYRLSFKIRNTNYRSLSTKALSIKTVRLVDQETGIDLFSSYAKFDYQYVLESLLQLRQTRQPLTADLEPAERDDKDNLPEFLLERVSKAITNRRRYFAYWQRHALKLSQADLVVSEEQSPRVGQEPLPHDHVQEQAQDPVHEQDRQPQAKTTGSDSKTLISATDVSTYRADLDDQFDTGTVISYATTARDIEGNTIDVPPPPADASSKPEFVCPYCWVLCPSKQGKGKAWKMHILHDLQPYVCTYPDCPDGDHLFASRRAWMEHERLCHRRLWRCFEKQHSDQLYKSEGNLHRHVSECHADLTESHIRDLLDLAETIVEDDRDACPFCNSAVPFNGGLYNHMAFHQESLAIFAAPRNLDAVEDAETYSNKAKGERSAGSLSSASLKVEDDDSRKYLREVEALTQIMENRRMLGLEHPQTLNSMFDLAGLYELRHRFKEAEDLYLEIIDIAKRVLGPEHSGTLSTMTLLSKLYCKIEEWEKAEDLLVQVTEIQKRVLGLEHDDTLSNMHCLAVAYQRQCRFKEARDVYFQIISIERRVRGPEDSETLSAMTLLSRVYCKLNEWKMAEELLMQVAEINKKVLGLNHPKTWKVMTYLADIWESLGKLGPDDDYTFQAKKKLEEWQASAETQSEQEHDNQSLPESQG